MLKIKPIFKLTLLLGGLLCSSPWLLWAGASLDYENSDAADFIDYGDTLYSDTLTLCAWCKFESVSVVRALIIKRNTVGTATDATSEFQLITGSTNIVSSAIYDTLGTEISANTTDTITANTWYFICATTDGANNTLKTWINGIEKASTIRGALSIRNTTSAIQTGARTLNNNTRWMDGLIAYLHVYNRALSASELLQIMQKPGSIVNGLIIYDPQWNLINQDLSGNGNNGTDYGTPVESADGPPVILSAGAQ